MNQFGPFVTLLGLAAVALTGLGALASRWNKEEQRLRRGLRKVLGEDPHALIIAPGRGRGAGFNFTSNTMAVAWDVGGWCLVYRIDELMGAELLIDGQVVARVWRGEARRALESMGDAEKQVAFCRLTGYPPTNMELMKNLPPDLKKLELSEAELEGFGNLAKRFDYMAQFAYRDRNRERWNKEVLGS